MNPSLGRNFEALEPLEWLARMSDHIPDPGQHSPRRRSSLTWARLIAKIYQVDPLVCTRCGQKMQMIAFLTDQLSIKRILDHLGLSEPPQDKSPPLREMPRRSPRHRRRESRRRARGAPGG
jgi:hypothetical protein